MTDLAETAQVGQSYSVADPGGGGGGGNRRAPLLNFDRLHCKNWKVKITPVGVNRGPHPQVLKLHPT